MFQARRVGSWRIGAYLGRVHGETKAELTLRKLLEGMERDGEILTFLSQLHLKISPEDVPEELRAETISMNVKLPTVIRPDYLVFFNETQSLDVEVDGASHEDEKRRERDRIRDRLLKKVYGIPTLRIPDKSVRVKNFPTLRKLILSFAPKPFSLPLSIFHFILSETAGKAGVEAQGGKRDA